MTKPLQISLSMFIVFVHLVAEVFAEMSELPPPARELTIDGTTTTKIARESAPEYLYVKDDAKVTAENLSLVSGSASGQSLLAISGGSAQMVFATEDAQTTIGGAARVGHVYLSNQSGGIVRGKSSVESLSLSDEAEAVVLDAGLGLVTLDDSSKLQIITPIVQPTEGKVSFPGLEIDGGAIVLNSERASITSPAQTVSYCNGLVTFQKAWGPPIIFRVVVCDSTGCKIPELLPDQIGVHPPPRRPRAEGTRIDNGC